MKKKLLIGMVVAAFVLPAQATTDHNFAISHQFPNTEVDITSNSNGQGNQQNNGNGGNGKRLGWNNTAVVPLPATSVLLVTGLAFLFGAQRNK